MSKKYEVPKRRPRSNPITDPVPGTVLARSSDPSTSKAAAWMNPGRRGTLRALLAEAFYEQDQDGEPLTWEQAAGVAGIEDWQASKRVSELHQRGIIEVIGEAPTRRGAMAQTYQLTDDGRVALRQLMEEWTHA